MMQTIIKLAQRTAMVPVSMEDRIEFGRALILQGYSPARAAEMAEQLAPNDGALQMLARHRLRYITGVSA